MKPGFITLFKRGRYLRLRDDEESHRERERFTAAAIGFCITRDPGFAKTFWTTICQGPGDPPAGSVHCLVEPEQWADLIVFNQTEKGEVACVVELKLDKPLAQHQNPEEPAFSKPSGYGRFVTEDRKVITTVRRRYVVLGAAPSPEFPARHAKLRLPLAIRHWADLERSLPSNGICRDLDELLQAFGVTAFRYRQTKNMRVKRSLRQAAEAHTLLLDTAAKMGLRVGPKSWDIQATSPDDPDYWCYGIGIRVKDAGRHQDAFKRMLGDHSDFQWLAWMGYEADRERDFHLLVELYPSSKAVKTVQRLLTRASNAAQWDIDVAPDGEPRTIRICGKLPTKKSDSEWFQSVLSAVGIR